MSFTTGLLSSAMPSHEQSIGLSPFVFEKDLNIEFRRTLQHLEPSSIDTTYHDIAMTPASLAGSSDTQSEPSPRPNDTYTSSPTTPGDSSTNESTSSTSSPPTFSDSSSPPSSTSSSLPFTPRTPQSPHQCPQCGEAFRLKGDLTKHWYRLHEKRFTCTDCGKAFNLKADLKRHAKSKHPGQLGKDHVPCEYVGCKEMFTRRDNMLRHMLEEHERGGRKRARMR